jgi:hypothetical protein
MIKNLEHLFKSLTRKGGGAEPIEKIKGKFLVIIMSCTSTHFLRVI